MRKKSAFSVKERCKHGPRESQSPVTASLKNAPVWDILAFLETIEVKPLSAAVAAAPPYRARGDDLANGALKMGPA